MLCFHQKLNDGYTVYQTFTNPPAVYWAGRESEPGRRKYFEDALAEAASWQRYDAQQVLSWTWYRVTGTMCGVPVDGQRLGDMLSWILDGCDTGEIEFAAVTMHAVRGLAARRAGGRVAILAALDVSARTEAGMSEPQPLDDLEGHKKRHAMFGEPQDLLWFDEDGNGPVDGIEVMVEVYDLGLSIECSVAFKVRGLGVGGGSMSPAQARELARQLSAAADWASSRPCGANPGADTAP